MRVGVDEAGGDDEAGRVDDALSWSGEIADFDDLAGGDGNIGAAGKGTSAVNDDSITD
ncbi:hypothetical protein D3C83_280180 [compost metagenome]